MEDFHKHKKERTEKQVNFWFSFSALCSQIKEEDKNSTREGAGQVH